MAPQQIIETLNRVYFSADPEESMALKVIARLIRNAKLFVDVGASLGQFTKLANEKMKDGDIVAIEPDPIRFKELSANVVRWRSAGRNRLRVLHAAVADRSGSVEFQATNSSVSGGLFRHDLKHLSNAARAEVEW